MSSFHPPPTSPSSVTVPTALVTRPTRRSTRVPPHRSASALPPRWHLCSLGVVTSTGLSSWRLWVGLGTVGFGLGEGCLGLGGWSWVGGVWGWEALEVVEICSRSGMSVLWNLLGRSVNSETKSSSALSSIIQLAEVCFVGFLFCWGDFSLLFCFLIVSWVWF
ncbi:hypothetical protein RJT34_08148 [Clitoria ternatea]|uniref:Uncharacterized protein n=1 Tax=Clitoria ternatea TaxID=43366 RepID=A0AAN9PVG8_CLITE